MSTYPINEGEQNQAGETYICSLIPVNDLTGANLTVNTGVIERSYGGPLSTFGETWTRDTLIEGDFGVSLDFTAGSNGATVRVDDLEVIVYYNLPATINETIEGTQPQNALTSVATNPRNDVKVAVGTAGTILRSTDNGQTWTQINTKFSGIDLFEVQVSGQVFYASGRNGLLIKSTDDGLTWNKQGTNTRNSIYSFSFRSPQLGWILVGAENLDIVSDAQFNSFVFRY